MSSKTVLITGGAGFIGLNLLSTFINSNYAKNIIVVDNFITSDRNKFYKILDKYKDHANVKIDFYDNDICTRTFQDIILYNYIKIDEIYHLASLASPPFYKKYPIQTLDVGYIGIKNMLELCKHYNSKLLYTSTSEVYGDAKEHPQNENYYGNVNSYGERSCYDESKRIGETLIYTYKKLYNVDTRIIRIFNTYGPYMNLDDGRIVTEIIRCLLHNDTLNIFGTGEQTRSLSFVDDTISMMLKVMDSNYTSPVNVGNNIEYTINQLVEIVCNVYNDYFDNNAKLQIKYTDIDKDDPKTRQPCLKLNNSIIGLFEKTSITEGIKKTITYFKDTLN